MKLTVDKLAAYVTVVGLPITLLALCIAYYGPKPFTESGLGLGDQADVMGLTSGYTPNSSDNVLIKESVSYLIPIADRKDFIADPESGSSVETTIGVVELDAAPTDYEPQGGGEPL